MASGDSLTPAQPSDGRGALALEARLLAPCCWNGTLDIHDSELARELRREIEARVGEGEAPSTIEGDLVARYGSRIRALPNEGALSATVTVLFAVIAFAALVLVLRVRRGKRPDVAPKQRRAPADLDARLDAELHDLD